MLKAGFARVDITPPLGTYVAGYYENRYATGVLDSLELNAVAFSDGEETALLIAADMLGIREAFATPLREKIAARVGVPADHIFLQALHQHTSIHFGGWDAIDNGNNLLEDTAYMSVLYRKFGDVAQMALDDMCEATLGVAERETDVRIAFIRRYLMKDGTVRCNPGFQHRDEIARPTEKADNTVRLMRFFREGKNDIALVNFSTHPDVVSGSKFSADWPGFVRRFVEADLAGVSCVLVNGAQGDSNHLDFMGREQPPATNAAERYAHSRFMGRTVADTVLKIWDKTAARTVDKVAAGVKIVFERTRTDGEEYYDECRELYEDCGVRGNKLHPSKSGLPIYEAYRIYSMRRTPLYQRIAVSVLTLGDTAFVGFGGEPFTHYAIAVRENFPGKFIIAACCVNGYEDYLPTRAAFAEGGYEPGYSPLPPSVEEDCVAAATALLNELNK